MSAGAEALPPKMAERIAGFMAEKKFYEAQQLYLMQTNRLNLRKQHELAASLALGAAGAMLGEGELNAAGELACAGVRALAQGGVPADDQHVDKIIAVADLFAGAAPREVAIAGLAGPAAGAGSGDESKGGLASPAGSAASSSSSSSSASSSGLARDTRAPMPEVDFLTAAGQWSAEASRGDLKHGSPRIQRALGQAWARRGRVQQAVGRLARGDAGSELAALFGEWVQAAGPDLDLRRAFLARTVLQCALAENFDAANRVFAAYKAVYPDEATAAGKGPAASGKGAAAGGGAGVRGDERSLLEFLAYALATFERDAAPLYGKLLQAYEPALTGTQAARDFQLAELAAQAGQVVLGLAPPQGFLQQLLESM